MGLSSIKLQPVLDPQCSERKVVNLLGVPVVVTIVCGLREYERKEK